MFVLFVLSIYEALSIFQRTEFVHIRSCWQKCEPQRGIINFALQLIVCLQIIYSINTFCQVKISVIHLAAGDGPKNSRPGIFEAAFVVTESGSSVFTSGQTGRGS
jgi:hypothetical protein